MEMMWPVLGIMVPLFAGGLIVLIMYWWGNPAGTRENAGGAEGEFDRRPAGKRRSLRLTPRTMAVGFAGTVIAVVLALVVGFPLVRALLMAFHTPIDPA